MSGVRDAPASNGPPVLSIEGVDGPLDWLLEMARAERLDLGKISILALIEAFDRALRAALAGEGGRADLSRWGDWVVMAATLALLRSRLLLPRTAAEERGAQEEAEALRRRVRDRARMQAAAHWLDQRAQLGHAVFARGGGLGEAARPRSADITDLLRACLAALRVPEAAEAFAPAMPPLWRVADAMARITHALAVRPEGGELSAFLPPVVEAGPDRLLRCRAAVASTLVAGLELNRAGAVSLAQDEAWRPIRISA